MFPTRNNYLIICDNREENRKSRHEYNYFVMFLSRITGKRVGNIDWMFFYLHFQDKPRDRYYVFKLADCASIGLKL